MSFSQIVLHGTSMFSGCCTELLSTGGKAVTVCHGVLGEGGLRLY